MAEDDPDVTRLEDAPTPPSRKSSPRSSRSVTSSSWLSTTDAIDHGRFEPGALFDDRYRIVGRLGTGGMGEVYRAAPGSPPSTIAASSIAI